MMNKIPRFLVDWLLAFPLTLSSYSKYGWIKVLGAMLLVPYWLSLLGFTYYLIFEL